MHLPKFINKKLFLKKLQVFWSDFIKAPFYINEPNQKKRFFYLSASLMDVVCIMLILINGAKPAERIIGPLISPFMNSLNSSHISFKNKTTDEVFSFAPGWSDSKLRKIDFNGLDYLSYFDLPINSDGTLKKDSTSYRSYDSNDTLDLIDRAHYSKTKVLLTITLAKNSDITSFLDNKSAWHNLVTASLDEVSSVNADGVTVDFEMRGSSPTYQAKFSQFIAYLTDQLHGQIATSTVAVAIPDNATNESLYDKEELSKSADRLLIMAYSVAVPEEKDSQEITPVFGYNDKDYWENISNSLNNFFSKDTDKTKLVMERAWYGNGDQYPLYVPSANVPTEMGNDASFVPIDQTMVTKLADEVPSKGRQAALKNIPIIAQALRNEGILDSNVLAYALATIEHETDETFAPIDEIQGRLSARRLGYEGGTNYFGRGFIQLTHLRNYKVMGQRIGMGDELVKNPSLASTPEVAAKILAAFFKDNNIANLASKGYFVAARRPINPDLNGYKVASLAWKYEGEME